MEGLLCAISPRMLEHIANENIHGWKCHMRNHQYHSLCDATHGMDNICGPQCLSRRRVLKKNAAIEGLLERAQAELVSMSQAWGNNPDEFKRTARRQIARLEAVCVALQKSIDWDQLLDDECRKKAERLQFGFGSLQPMHALSEQLRAEFVVRSMIGFIPQGASSHRTVNVIHRLGGNINFVDEARLAAAFHTGDPDSDSGSFSGSEANEFIDDAIEHVDEPAVVPPEEAEVIASDLHHSLLQWNADSAGINSADVFLPRDDSDGFERVVLLKYARSPEQFDEVLERELEPVIHLLREAGHDWRLPSGAKVISSPHHFQAVVAHMTLNQYILRPCHVIVTEALEGLVRDAVSILRSRLNVRLRQREMLGYVDADGAPILVQRTFINIPATTRLASQSVVQSTTEVHSRAVNPRRLHLARDA